MLLLLLRQLRVLPRMGCPAGLRLCVLLLKAMACHAIRGRPSLAVSEAAGLCQAEIVWERAFFAGRGAVLLPQQAWRPMPMMCHLLPDGFMSA